jgi:hypothetical protein
MITRFSVVAIVAAAFHLALVAPVAAAPARFAVLHHERLPALVLERRATPDAAGQAGDAGARLRFEALGRAFDLRLEPNARLLASLGDARRAALGDLSLWRGVLAGEDGSWARVGVHGGRIHALVYDGQELYAIEPAARIAAHLVQPDAGDGEVIYRLRDVTGSFHDDAIVPVGAASGTFAAMAGALAAARPAAGAAAMRRLDVALLGDFEFRLRHPDADAELLLRANYVDGIFSQQLGLQISVGLTRTVRSEPDAFSGADATSLLESAAAHRSTEPTLRGYPLVHLFTGRDLSGSTVGIAYIGGVCDPMYGVGVTQSSMSVFHDALIAAHEIGHNLGARHDAEAGSPCESTPPTYLMAPTLSGSDRFSQCSLTAMSAVVARAACIATAHAGDVRVQLDVAERALLGEDAAVHLAVDNAGNDTATNVVVTLVPAHGATIRYDGADARCAVSADGLACAIGGLAPGARVEIDAFVAGGLPGDVEVVATAHASNDTNPGNDAVSRTVTFDPAVVLEVAVAPEEIVVGSSGAAVEISIGNSSVLAATGVALEVASPLDIDELAVNGGTCERADADRGVRYACMLGTIASGASRVVRGRLRPADVAAGGVVTGLLSATAVAVEPLARAGTNGASAVVRAYPAVADVVASVVSAPVSMDAGASARVVVTLAGLGPDPAPEAALRIEFPVGVTVTGVEDASGACAVEGGAVRCAVERLAPDETLEVVVDVVAERAGDLAWTVEATHAGLDPEPANDTRELPLSVTSETRPPTTNAPPPSGGGGASWLLAALAAASLARRFATPVPGT